MQVRYLLGGGSAERKPSNSSASRRISVASAMTAGPWPSVGESRRISAANRRARRTPSIGTNNPTPRGPFSNPTTDHTRLPGLLPRLSRDLQVASEPCDPASLFSRHISSLERIFLVPWYDESLPSSSALRAPCLFSAQTARVEFSRFSHSCWPRDPSKRLRLGSTGQFLRSRPPATMLKIPLVHPSARQRAAARVPLNHGSDMSLRSHRTRNVRSSGWCPLPNSSVENSVACLTSPRQFHPHL